MTYGNQKGCRTKRLCFFQGVLSSTELNVDLNILIYHGKKQGNITIISVYVDNFLLVSKYRVLIDQIKQKLKIEYNVKNFGDMKIIIGQEVTCHKKTLKIDKSIFIRHLFKEQNLTKCNLIIISIKAGSIIDMSRVGDYKEVDPKVYQKLIRKLMYILYNARPNIAFGVTQLSK